MGSSTVSMLVALAALVVLSGYFSATETAFTSLNRIRLKSRADAGDRRAARALELSEDFDRLLSSLLIGNNIVNNVATTLGAVLFIDLLGQQKGPSVSAAVLTVVILVFGEVTPKSLAKEHPEAWAMIAAPLMKAIMTVLTPLNFLFAQWKRLLSRLFRSQTEDGITEEELVGMVNQAETDGSLDQHESDLIRNAIEFNDMEVSEILTPRVDLAALPDNASMEQAAALFVESGYSRLPLYHDSIDNIIGVIHEKDFYAARYRGEEHLAALKGPVLYTAGSAKISELLRTLQQKKIHMAVVVDEYGGTEGVVTMEDIMEELVGEIWDEHDEVVERFRKQSDGSYLIACSADLDDLYDLLQVRGGCSDAATVSGWVMERLGRVPEVGDGFCSDGLEVSVTRVEHRRAMEIRVRRLPEEPAERESRKAEV